MFQVGDRVVYCGAGVCCIKEISTVEMDGVDKDKLFYILNPVGREDSVIYAPTENGRTVMRPVLQREEAEALIRGIPDIEPLPPIDSRSREAVCRESIKSCDCRNLIQIIKSLYLKGQARAESGRRALNADERYLRQAEDILYAELAVALDIERKSVQDYICGVLDGQ